MNNKIDIITKIIDTNLKNHNNKNIFDLIANDINNLVDNKIAHTMKDIKDKNNCKKEKGDLWESFCYLYLLHVLNHDFIWFYKDFPLSMKQTFHLTKNDFGIDLISIKDGKYYAIQCKFKKPQTKVQTISWRSLATFYAIITKTGPWEKNIIMTNVNSCKHIGQKTKKDLSLCIGTFRSTTHFEWLKIVNHPNTTNNVNHPNTTNNVNQFIRESRLKYFEKNIII